MSTFEEVLAGALQLSVAERAQLVSELIASVDGAPDPDAGSAWASEIERRARRALAGDSTGTDWSVVKARLETRSPRR